MITVKLIQSKYNITRRDTWHPLIVVDGLFTVIVGGGSTLLLFTGVYKGVQKTPLFSGGKCLVPRFHSL